MSKALRVKSLLGTGAILVALLLLGACTTPRPPPASTLEVPELWREAGGSEAIGASWWRGFGSPRLDELVEQALDRNHDLRLAAARLDEARALLRAQQGAAWPDVSLGVGAQRARSISDVSGRPFYATSYQTQVQVAYEVDITGRIAALEAAAGSNAGAAEALRDAVVISVAASVVNAYVGLVALDAQLDLARRTLASREQSLKLIRSRQSVGYGSALESAQAEAELFATAQTIPQIELARQRLELVVCTLLARAPGPIERDGVLLDAPLRPLPDAGLPSQLLRRRPDIAAAERQLMAADSQYAAARAQLLPSLHLGADVSRVGASVLAGDPYTVWTIGGSVLAPIFNGGRLRAQAEASASRRDQALIGYERTVVAAFAEVDSQLVAFRRIDEQARAVGGQREATSRSLAIAQRRYGQGYGSYLDVLLAQRSLFATEQTLIQLRSERLQDEVNVIKALGGGWSGSDSAPPTPEG